MPSITGGITLGIGDLCACRRIQLAVFGKAKAPLVSKLLSLGAPDTEFPASALLAIPDAELLIDMEAASP
jgi:6-phosphogluconolactonase/glucosamine-6-phosphate isomerase/deaminase